MARLCIKRNDPDGHSTASISRPSLLTSRLAKSKPLQQRALNEFVYKFYQDCVISTGALILEGMCQSRFEGNLWTYSRPNQPVFVTEGGAQ